MMSRRMPRLGWVAMLLVAGCGTPNQVHVDLRTDLVPGPELARIQLRAYRPAGALVGDAERAVTADDDGLAGIRVGTLTLDAGRHRLEVALLDGEDAVLAERPVLVDVQGDQVVTVVLGRSCGDVRCDSGQACFSGECVNAACSSEDPSACGEPRCELDADCAGGAAPCSIGACVDGACLAFGDHARCGAEQWCHADVGCRDLGSPPPEPPVEACEMTLADDVVEDTTIPAGCVVHVPGGIGVHAGAFLTVEEGVTVQLGPQASIWIGGGDCSECEGGIVARGSAERPIHFTADGPRPGPGSWGALVFEPGTLPNSVVEHARFEYGGHERLDDELGAIHVRSPEHGRHAAITIRSCVFEHNAGGGLSAYGGHLPPHADLFVELRDNELRDNGPFAMQLGPSLVGSLDASNVMDAPVRLRGDHDVSHAATWAPRTYVASRSLELNERLTLEAGTVLRFSAGARLEVGTAGSLIADGVVFEAASVSPLPGDWNGLYFGAAERASRILNSTIRHAGDDAPVRVIDTDVEIAGTTFEQSAGTRNIAVSDEARCPAYLSAVPPNRFDLPTACAE